MFVSVLNRLQANIQPRRRGVVAVFTLVILFVLFGFASLTLDVGAMYNAKADLQDAADAAALAAAGSMMEPGDVDMAQVARTVADSFTEANTFFGRDLKLASGEDVLLGIARLDENSGSYTFEATERFPNAVRVRVRLAEDSPNGKLPLYFAGLFGHKDATMTASATAVMAPRDIALVVDISGSISFDSQLRSMRETRINLFEVWNALPVEKGNNGVGNGIDPPPPGNPNSSNEAPGAGPGNPVNRGGNPDPGADPQGGQMGPTWGWMYNWGNELDSSYEPSTDPALVYLPYARDWNNPDLENWYHQIGYTPDEMSAMLSGNDDSRDWSNRVAVALGLARWDSGKPNGVWESVPPGQRNSGDGDNRIESNELTWLVDYPFENGTWRDYIEGYAGNRYASMLEGSRDFRYRFGLKTFTDFLLSKRGSNEDTPELADVPMQPLHAIKEAGTLLSGGLQEMQSADFLGLISYATIARREVDLTNNFTTVGDRLQELQARHYGDGSTNIGGGLLEAMQEVTGDNSRSFARKVIVLLTDGVATVDASGNGSYSGGQSYALAAAREAANRGVRIYTVSVGVGADQDLMRQIAEIGDGQHFHAEGDIDTYSDQLSRIFLTIGGLRSVQLIQ